jgi:copper chaperone CopZ
METLIVQTNLHCQGCVDAIKPALERDNKIENWQVDLEPAIKTLTVSGNQLNEAHVNQVLNSVGYEVLDTKKQHSFWFDKPKWKRASFNTLNCLIGCSIGDFGMIIFLQAFYPSTSMMWQMILAIIAGLTTSIALETMIMHFREGFKWPQAFNTAISMSFISMIAMEIAMNLTDFMVTGGKAAFEDPMYWSAFGIAAIAGFITPLPYNYYRLKKYNQACH